MATAVLQPASLPIPRSMSTPQPSTATSSSSSSSQPLIDHALLMLTLSRRLSTTEHEQERAVEMREDALKLLVLGEEMQRAEEREQSSSTASSPQLTPPESPSVSQVSQRRMEEMDALLKHDDDVESEGGVEQQQQQQQDSGFYHLIPPAYTFDSDTSSASASSLSSSTSAAVAAAMQSLPTTALVVSSPSSPHQHPLSRVNSSTTLTTTSHLNPDAITSSLSTLLTQADLLLSRLHNKYNIYLSPLLTQSQSTLTTLMESEEARVMVSEGRGVVREWREFMTSREGDAMVQSLLSMMAAQQLGVTDLIKYATDAVASVVTGGGSSSGSGGAAADAQSAMSAATNSATSSSSSSFSSPSSSSSALVPVNPSTSTAVTTSSSANNHTFLYTLPTHIHSFLLTHPELNLFLLRAQSALLTPDPPLSASAASPPSELDTLLSAFQQRTSSLLTSLSSPATAHQLPNGKTQLLSTQTTELLSDLSHPLLTLIKSPERLFSEAVLLLMRGRSRCQQVLDELKHLIIQQLSTALSNLTLPAVEGGNTSFQYTIAAFTLHSFHLHADDIVLSTSDTGGSEEEGRLVVEIRRVDAEARDVAWSCKQLVFPYMSGSGTLDVRLREASMRLEIGIATTTANTETSGGVRLVDLQFSFPSLSFHISNTSFSSVYNLLLSLFGPLLRSELERAVNVAARDKVAELLSLVNEYGGGEVVRRWWISHRKAVKEEEELKESSSASGSVLDSMVVVNGLKPADVMTSLMADVMRDSADDDRNTRLTEAALAAASSATLPPPAIAAAAAAAVVSASSSLSSVVAAPRTTWFQRQSPSTSASHAPSASVDSFSTPPPPRHPSATHRSTLSSRSTPVSACVSPSSASSSSSSSSSGRLTPSSSSPFLRTSTPPILLAYPDTASGW